MKLQTHMPLVVLTYPGHFLLTVYTIKSYLDFHTPTDIIVIADDLSEHAWPSYLSDCEKLYGTTVVPLSQLQPTKRFNNGWMRQQIAKLHLDQTLNTDRWFFTDGDIVFLHSVDPAHTPYSIPDFGPTSQQQLQYLQHVLQIKNPGIWVQTHLVCVSDPPFRGMCSEVLSKLRTHVSDRVWHTGPGMSEWELIENFRLHVLKQPLDLVRYAPHNISNPDKKLDYFQHQFLTHYQTDKDLGRDFFDFDVTDDLWQQLSKISK